MLTRNEFETKEAGRLSFRAPAAHDGSGIHALVQRCQPLDVNSRYCYLILCEHFSSTCLVAEEHDAILAFVTAYIPPDRPDTLFVWQVAVDAALRGQGVAKAMVQNLMRRPALRHIRYVEGTVNPSNDASRSLFHWLAREMEAEVHETLLFPTEMLGENHEQENLIRVGPFDLVGKT